MESAEIADILIEIIEVLINQILYLRDAYPQQIFKKRRIYNAPVYTSTFPPLNAYLHNVLRSARELLNGGELKRVEVIFYIDENSAIERHIIELSDTYMMESLADDEFLLDFEEKLRKSLYEMPEHMKMLNKLPNEAKMKIRVHTTQNGHIRLSSSAHFQDFPWIQNSPQECTAGTSKQCFLLPLTTFPKLGINILTEVS